MKPTKGEVSTAVEDSERALFDFTAAFSGGTLGDMDPGQAAELIRHASESVRVAENAFGVAENPEDTPDALASRMFGVYADASAARLIDDGIAAEQGFESRRRARSRAVVRSVLGISADDEARMDFDRENGDWSPWLEAHERFVFGG